MSSLPLRSIVLLLPEVRFLYCRKRQKLTAINRAYLAGPFLLILYIGWKAWSWFKHPEQRPLFVRIKDIDIYDGMREGQRNFISGSGVTADQRRESIAELQDEQKKKGAKDWARAAVHSVF